MSAVTVAGGTKIEWADFTFNPWWGCEKVSPGCAHCYAETLSHRRGFYPVNGQGGLWGDGHGFRFFGDKHWEEPLRWARNAPAKLGRRPRVFCASMADVFEERPELNEHRLRLFDLILATPELDWLILTKRPEFARDWLAKVESFELPEEWPIPNLWLGVSIENSRFTWRADVLREIPAAVRFISAEPLLGSLYDGSNDDRASHDSNCDAGAVPAGLGGEDRRSRDRASVREDPDAAGREHLGARAEAEEQADLHARRAPLDLSGIDWVIVGGESGHGARPFHLEHAREIVSACRLYRHEAHVGGELLFRSSPAVFVKQLGAKPVERSAAIVLSSEYPAGGTYPLKLRDSKGGDMSEWPADLRIREFPEAS